MKDLEKVQTVEELLELWQQRHQNKRKNRFIKDGIINENIWHKTEVKVCFLLKESYFDASEYEKDVLLPDRNLKKHHWNAHISCHDGHYVYDLAEHLNKHEPWFMWRKVENWTKVLLQILGLSVATPIQNIAVINIKKSEGVSESDYQDILSYAYDDCVLIRKEIELVDPDIIICGATYDYCVKAGLFDAPQEVAVLKDFGSRKVLRYGKRIILDCYHPSARISYEKVEKFFKEALQHVKIL